MRARTKASKRYFCGEARSYDNGMAFIKLISADSEQEALFAYVEERETLTAEDEILIVEAGPSKTFILMDDEPTEAETADTQELETVHQSV